MDVFSQNKLLIWLAAILILLNLFSLTGIWIIKTKRQFPTQHIHPAPPFGTQITHPELERLERLVLEFKFNPDQMEKYKELRKKHYEDMKKSMGNIYDTKKQIYNEILSSHPDTSKVQQLLINIGLFQSELEKVIYLQHKEIKSICDDEQKNHFENAIKEIIEIPNPLSPE